MLAAVITLIVLHKRGVLASGGGSYTPLPYYQRERNTTAEPAFAAELHPWLLPKELAALEMSPSADVIVVGAGVAGLRAAQVLAANMSVLVVEARVRPHACPPPASPVLFHRSHGQLLWLPACHTCLPGAQQMAAYHLDLGRGLVREPMSWCCR